MATPFLQPSRAEQTIAEQIREDRHRKVYSPADAINALTVGALHLDHSPPTATGRLVDLLDDAKHAMPSPISRIGPGFRGAIKPELLVAGGRQLYDECLRDVKSALNSYRVPPTGTRPPGQCTAAPSTRPGDVSATYYARGTSNAAALVSRAAAQLYEVLLELRREPGGDQLRPECLGVLLKAILTHMAVWGDAVEVWADIFREMSQRNVDRRTVRRYLSRFFGYGIPDPWRRILDTSHRARVSRSRV